MDLTKFVFKYAKAPTEKFTIIHLKDIIDVQIEADPQHFIEKQARSQERNSSLFSAGMSIKKADNEGFNF